MHGALGEDEHHVRTAGAASLPGLELEAGEVGNEIGLPHVAARAHGNELAFAAEVFGRALAFRKLVRVIEHKGFVVKQIEHEREIVRGGEPRAFASARIEVLIAGVERQREQALGPPFEAVLASVARFDGGVAVSGQHVDHLLEEMLLRRRLPPRGKIEDEDGDEIATSLQVHDAAVDPKAGPWRGRDLKQIDPEILGDRDAFLRRPRGVGVEQHLGVRDICDRLIHGRPRKSAFSYPG